MAELKINHQQSEEILRWYKNCKNFLVFIGNPGIGKTYFCAAMCNYILAKKNQTCRYWSEGRLLTRIRASIDGGGDYLKSLELLIDDHYVILDDLGSNGVNDWRKEIMFEFINRRYESGLPTIITSNLTRKDILDKYESRFYSRLFAKENSILEIAGPDWRQEGM